MPTYLNHGVIHLGPTEVGGKQDSALLLEDDPTSKKKKYVVSSLDTMEVDSSTSLLNGSIWDRDVFHDEHNYKVLDSLVL